jgi:hypothetical protein
MLARDKPCGAFSMSRPECRFRTRDLGPLKMRSNAYRREIVAEDCPTVSLSLIWDNGTGAYH